MRINWRILARNNSDSGQKEELFQLMAGPGTISGKVSMAASGSKVEKVEM